VQNEVNQSFGITDQLALNMLLEEVREGASGYGMVGPAGSTAGSLADNRQHRGRQQMAEVCRHTVRRLNLDTG
jgi:hypothetical protein